MPKSIIAISILKTKYLYVREKHRHLLYIVVQLLLVMSLTDTVSVCDQYPQIERKLIYRIF